VPNSPPTPTAPRWHAHPDVQRADCEELFVIRGYLFTLDPTPTQERALRSHCGAARFAFNHMLHLVRANLDQRTAERSYDIDDANLTPPMGWSFYTLLSHWNTVKRAAAPWWADVSKEAFATGTRDLAAALKNWADARTGRRAGRSGFPRFKSRRTAMSCTYTTGPIRVETDRHHVTLPRLGTLHVHETTARLGRLMEQGRARITRATISYRRGRWQVSLLIHLDQAAPAHRKPGTVVGVDLGVKEMLVAATPAGTEVLRVPAPGKLRDLDRRKRTLQRRNRHRQGPRKGVAPSKRWLRAQRRIDRCDWSTSRIREDLLHKVTTDLARRFETVVVEDLNVAGMMTRGGAHKRGLNRGIARSAMATVRRMLNYKTTWAGGRLHVVDRFYPSSKTCSECGSVRAKLLLSERTYVCTYCGCAFDRDMNAATNLARQGPSITAESGSVAGRGAEQRTGNPSGLAAAGDETSTPPPERTSDGDRLPATASLSRII
jgi:putative transposase